MDAVVLDSIINRLLQVSTDSPREYQLRILEAEICELCVVSSKIFLQQPNLLELEAPINVCGDIHGQYSDLLRFFDRGGFPPAGKYLFLGNYAGKGGQSVETMCLLLAYKIRYPDSFFLLRGNHDCESMARMWGFRDECKARFNARLWRLFVACFDCLPAAAIIGGKVICLHGGLSPVLTDLDQIRAMARPADVPPAGLLCDILWSDPSKEVPRWGLKLRGLSYIFGAEVVSEFLHRNGLALLCRSHQVVDDGYEYFAGEKLVTVFSAPSFCGEYMNAGSMMSIDGDLKHSFITLRPPTERRLKFFPRALSKPGASSRVKLAEWKIELFGTSRAGKVRTTPGVKRASSIEMAQGKLYRATNGARSLPPRNYLRYDQGPVTNVDHSTISIQSLTMTSSSMYSTDNDDDVTLDWDTLSQPMFEEVEEIPSMRYL